MLSHDHNIWVLLFEQTPTVLRWILGILSCGLFWLAQRLYLNHKQRVDNLENLIRSNAKASDKSMVRLHTKIDNLTLNLLNKK